MSKKFDYVNETLKRYQDPATARHYQSLYTESGHGLNGLLVRTVNKREKAIVARMLDDAVGDGSTTSLLDVPCGAGKLAEVVSGYASRIVAADVSTAMIDLARPVYMNTTGFAEFRVADAANLPFDTGEFDVVICLRLLHRVPSDLRLVMLRELARVSSRTVIFSVGIYNEFERIRLALRRCILSRSVASVSCKRSEVRDMVDATSLRIVKEKSILGPFASEWIFHTEKQAR